MHIEMIAIGNELLDGRVHEGNGIALARKLRQLGETITQVVVIRDDHDVIEQTLAASMARADVVVMSGGLGVTEDDITRQAVAKWMGVDVVEHGPSADAVEARLRKRGRSFRAEDRVRVHAHHPAGTRALDNPVGLAIGFAHHTEQATLFVLPGVPSEFRAMVDAHVTQHVRDAQTVPWSQRRMTFFGRGERTLERRIAEAGIEIPPDVTFGITANDAVIEISLSAQGEAIKALDPLCTRVLAPDCLGLFRVSDDGTPLVVRLGDALRQRGQTVATAESCTGGLIVEMLTSIAGSSAYVIEGAVTYSNDAKRRRLEVHQETLDRYGAVSRHTALEMVEGIRRRSGADWGIATTGIAGPGGGRPGKPVGLVHMAIAGKGQTLHRPIYFPTRPRRLIQAITANAALSLLLCLVEGRDPWPAIPLPDDVEQD